MKQTINVTLPISFEVTETTYCGPESETVLYRFRVDLMGQSVSAFAATQLYKTRKAAERAARKWIANWARDARNQSMIN